MESSQQISRTKSSLAEATEQSRLWFEANSIEVQRNAFDLRSKKGKSPQCAVYVYYGKDGALYVGQSKRRIKLRLHDQTSPHRRKPWWHSWSIVRYLPLQEETDRLVLELMLILAYVPPNNHRPAGKHVAELFAP